MIFYLFNFIIIYLNLYCCAFDSIKYVCFCLGYMLKIRLNVLLFEHLKVHHSSLYTAIVFSKRFNFIAECDFLLAFTQRTVQNAFAWLNSYSFFFATWLFTRKNKNKFFFIIFEHRFLMTIYKMNIYKVVHWALDMSQRLYKQSLLKDNILAQSVLSNCRLISYYFDVYCYYCFSWWSLKHSFTIESPPYLIHISLSHFCIWVFVSLHVCTARGRTTSLTKIHIVNNPINNY